MRTPRRRPTTTRRAPSVRPSSSRRHRAVVLAATVAVLLAVLGTRPPAASAASAIESTYAAPGTYAVTTSTVTGPGGAVLYQVYRPTTLGAGGHRHPIVTWGNGSGATPADYPGVLNHLASWGYVVIASTSSTTGTGAEILAAAQWLVAQDTTPGSIYQGTLDTAHVAAVGHSQGAGGVVNATNDSGGLITTVVPINLPNRIWVSAGDEYAPADLDVPAFFLTGATDYLIAGPSVTKGFYDEVPGAAARAALKGVGHNGIQGTGGRFRGYLTAWLRYQLDADATARAAFVGTPPELLTNTAWTAQATKHLT